MNAALFPLNFDGTAVITDDGRSVSYAELRQLCDNWHLEIAPRSLVFLLVSNTLESLVAYVACLRRGIVPLLLDAKLDPQLLSRFESTYHPNYIINTTVSPNLQPQPSTLNSQHKTETSTVDLHLHPTPKTKTTTVHLQPSPSPNNSRLNLFPELALLLTTSGSTGSPKLVRQSYANIAANTASIIEYLHLDASERPITTLPMNYTYGLSIINSHLHCGATLLLTNKTLMQREFWNFFNEQQATSFGGVPYTYEMLDKLLFFRRKLPTLRTMTQAGGKLLPALHQKFAEYAQREGKHFVVMYGQCEATARMSYLPPDRALDKVGSMGIAIPGGKFSLIDVDGKEIEEPEVTGELVYGGKNVTLGYAECADDLAKGDERNGRLLTGDMAKRDADGFYYIVGRKKRFLKIFGNRVNLDETERLIKSAFPNLDIACGGVDDKMKIYVESSSTSSTPLHGQPLSPENPCNPCNPWLNSSPAPSQCSPRQSDLDAIRNFVADKTHLNFTAFDVRYIDKIPKNDAGKTLYKELPE